MKSRNKIFEKCFEVLNLDTKNVEYSLSFVSEKKIKELNNEYRNIDEVTDVLSFPQYENYYLNPPKNNLPIFLGDVVICKNIAKKQAEEIGHPLEKEIDYLFCHSIFHLLGFDHMNDSDKKLMREKEKEVISGC